MFSLSTNERGPSKFPSTARHSIRENEIVGDLWSPERDCPAMKHFVVSDDSFIAEKSPKMIDTNILPRDNEGGMCTHKNPVDSMTMLSSANRSIKLRQKEIESEMTAFAPSEVRMDIGIVRRETDVTSPSSMQVFDKEKLLSDTRYLSSTTDDSKDSSPFLEDALEVGKLELEDGAACNPIQDSFSCVASTKLERCGNEVIAEARQVNPQKERFATSNEFIVRNLKENLSRTRKDLSVAQGDIKRVNGQLERERLDFKHKIAENAEARRVIERELDGLSQGSISKVRAYEDRIVKAEREFLIAQEKIMKLEALLKQERVEAALVREKLSEAEAKNAQNHAQKDNSQLKSWNVSQNFSSFYSEDGGCKKTQSELNRCLDMIQEKHKAEIEQLQKDKDEILKTTRTVISNLHSSVQQFKHQYYSMDSQICALESEKEKLLTRLRQVEDEKKDESPCDCPKSLSSAGKKKRQVKDDASNDVPIITAGKLLQTISVTAARRQLEMMRSQCHALFDKIQKDDERDGLAQEFNSDELCNSRSYRHWSRQSYFP